MKHQLLSIPCVLAACGTPQEQCINAGNHELRTVERLIAETQGNLDRGYALEEVTITEEHWGFCHPHVRKGQPPLPLEPCLVEHDITVERARAIDPAEEARKLEGLKAKRVALAKAAEPVIAQCRADHPE